MIAHTSAVNTDAESGNLMEITVFDGKTVAQAVNNLCKQEYIHGTCLVFPSKAADIHMHLCDLSSAARDLAQSSVVRYTKVVTQNMKVFPKCLKYLCWKQFKTA